MLNTQKRTLSVREQTAALSKSFERINAASLMTGTGLISFRSGKLIAYPPIVAWARMQSFFFRAKGGGELNSFPFSALYSAKHAARKYVDSLNMAHAVLLACTPENLNILAQPLFEYVRSSQSLAGLESIFLSMVNALGKSKSPLFADGISLWTNYRSTFVPSSTIVLVDKQLGVVAVIPGKDLPGLDLGKGVQTNDFFGGLAAKDPTFEKVAQNPIDKIIGEATGYRATAENVCIGVFSAAGGLIGGIVGFTAAGVGAVGGVGLGLGAGATAGMIVCGVIYTDDNKDSSSHSSSGSTSSTSSSSSSTSSSSNSTEQNYSNTSSSSETSNICSPDTSSDDEDESSPGDDDDEMPDPEGDHGGGPNWLDMKTFDTATIPNGGGLKSLISFGPKGIAIMHDIPIIDFASERIISRGLTATAPVFVGTLIDTSLEVDKKSLVEAQNLKGEWILYPKDWVMIQNHINARSTNFEVIK